MQFDPKDNLKPLALAGCGVIAFVFAAAGCGTPFVTMSNDFVKMTMTFYNMEVCINDVCQSEAVGDVVSDECSHMLSAMQAAAAFSIISTLVLAGAVAMSLATIKVQMLQKFVAAPFAAAALTLLISWPITIALFSSMKCKEKTLSEGDDNSIGPSGILQLFAWFITLAAIAASFILPNPVGGAKPQPSTSTSNVEALSAEML